MVAAKIRISVATFLRPKEQYYVKKVLAAIADVFAATSWAELSVIIRQENVGLVLLDPAADGVMNLNAVRTLLKTYPLLPLVAYVRLSKSSFKAVAYLSKRGLNNIILQQYEDAPKQFRKIIMRAAVTSSSAQLLREFSYGINGLPIKLADELERMFASPRTYRNVHDLAVRAEMSTIQVYRDFASVGLPRPRKFVVAARLLKGYDYLLDKGYSVGNVSQKIGYHTARVFGRHCLQVFRMHPTNLRPELSKKAAVSRVLEWLTNAPVVEMDSGGRSPQQVARERSYRRATSGNGFPDPSSSSTCVDRAIGDVD